MIKERTNVVDLFSTFIQWGDHNSSSWQAEPRLNRNMSRLMQQWPDRSKQQWEAFWHRQWSLERYPMSQGHLYAYLQEPCYLVARELVAYYPSQYGYSVADYFNYGVIRFESLLQKYDPQTNANFGGFSVTFLRRRIRDELRGIHKGFGQTQWSLLFRSSPKRIKEALNVAGILDELQEQHLLAVECYVEIYEPIKRKPKGKILEPLPETWAQITEAYNALVPIPADSKTIQKWVKKTGQSLYSYLAPRQESLNEYLPNSKQERMDYLEAPSELSSAEDEGNDSFDYSSTHQKILAWVKERLATLDLSQYRLNPKTFEILQLYHGRNLKQSAIAKQLGINQSNISRILGKVNKILTEDFIEWSANNLDYTVQADNLEQISEALTQCLVLIHQPSAE